MNLASFSFRFFKCLHSFNEIFIHTSLNFMCKSFMFVSHNSKFSLELFKVFGYPYNMFIATSRKTLSVIPLKVTADENEAITKLTFNQSSSTATNLTLAFGYLGTVNTRSDTG